MINEDEQDGPELVDHLRHGVVAVAQVLSQLVADQLLEVYLRYLYSFLGLHQLMEFLAAAEELEDAACMVIFIDFIL